MLNDLYEYVRGNPKDYDPTFSADGLGPYWYHFLEDPSVCGIVLRTVTLPVVIPVGCLVWWRTPTRD